MTDQEHLQRLLATACRASDAQVDRIVEQASELKALRRTMWRAYAQLRAGRADSARRTLQQALIKPPP